MSHRALLHYPGERQKDESVHLMLVKHQFSEGNGTITLAGSEQPAKSPSLNEKAQQINSVYGHHYIKICILK